MVEEDGGGWGGGRWRTEEGGVERVFWRPRSTNGESDGWGGPCSVWDALVFGFFEQKMGRACLKFGESTNFAPLLNFGPTAGRG